MKISSKLPFWNAMEQIDSKQVYITISFKNLSEDYMIRILDGVASVRGRRNLNPQTLDNTDLKKWDNPHDLNIMQDVFEDCDDEISNDVDKKI